MQAIVNIIVIYYILLQAIVNVVNTYHILLKAAAERRAVLTDKKLQSVREDVKNTLFFGGGAQTISCVFSGCGPFSIISKWGWKIIHINLCSVKYFSSISVEGGGGGANIF